MAYKKLPNTAQHAQPTKTSMQAHAREENLRWYEMCGDERGFALHKGPEEGERIRKFDYVRKGKRGA